MSDDDDTFPASRKALLDVAMVRIDKYQEKGLLHPDLRLPTWESLQLAHQDLPSLDALRPQPFEQETLDEFEMPSNYLLRHKFESKPNGSFLIRNVEDTAKRHPIVTHDDADPESWDKATLIRVSDELRSYTFNHAWPYPVPRVHVSVGVGPNGRSDALDIGVAISFEVKHAHTGEPTEIKNQFVIAQEQAERLAEKFEQTLQKMVMHEFYEALMKNGRYVTEPHGPPKQYTFKVML